MTFRRLALRVAGITVSAYVAVAALIYGFQDRLLYDADASRTPPDAVGLTTAREVGISSADGTKLIAWYTAPKPGRPTVLFLHGKGGALKDRPGRYRYYVSRGLGVLFLSYRGYGGSAGQPGEVGMVEDAVAAYGWLMAQGVDPEQLFVVGESLGTGVAVQLAARQKIGALALEAPYTSIADVAKRRYWWLPVDLLLHDRFDSLAAIVNVRVPLLIHHGDLDRSVPIEFGRALFDRANRPKQFVELKNKGHFIFTKAVFEREILFFESILSRQ